MSGIALLPGRKIRERRQVLQVGVQVEDSQVGVNLHGQIDVAVPHEGLGIFWVDTGAGEIRPESVPQSVKIEMLAFRVGIGQEIALAPFSALLGRLGVFQPGGPGGVQIAADHRGGFLIPGSRPKSAGGVLFHQPGGEDRGHVRPQRLPVIVPAFR